MSERNHPFNIHRNWKNRIHYTYHAEDRKNCCDTYQFIKAHFPPVRDNCATCVYVYMLDILYVHINKSTGCQVGPGVMYEFFISV